MRRLLPLVLLVAALTAAGAAAFERFPAPDFESGYELPSPTTPSPRGLGHAYVDLALLAAWLGLAAWLVHRRRSRWAILALMLAALAYFGFYRAGCVCPIGAIQNVALGLSDPGYAVPWVVLGFLALPLVFTLFFGRVFCAAVCPLGAVQDAALVRAVRVPGWLSALLGMAAFAFLALAVMLAAGGQAFIICRYDPFVGFFRASGTAFMLVLGVFFLLLSMFVGRPYCRWLCPLGAVFSGLGHLARFPVRLTPQNCVRCGLCTEACPFEAIKKPDPDTPPKAAEKALLVGAFVAAPLMALGLAHVGWRAGLTLAADHPVVDLAQRVHAAETAPTGAAIADDAVTAFHATGEAPADLYRRARSAAAAMQWGWAAVAGFLGLVIGLRIIGRVLREGRDDYRADRGACMACGRCYDYCPCGRRKATVAGARLINPPTAETARAPIRRSGLRVAWLVALVAAVLTLVLAGVLLAQHRQLRQADILESDIMTGLQARLAEDPANQALIEEIRQADLQLRAGFFQRQVTIGRLRWLLVATLVSLLLATRSAAYLCTKTLSPPRRDQPKTAQIPWAEVAALLGFGVALAVVGLVVAARADAVVPADWGRVADISLPELERPPYSWPDDATVRQQWPRWRGPGGLGVAADSSAPTSWDAATGKNIRWRAAVPLPGHNSPVVWEDAVFLTGATAEQRAIFCYDAQDGALRWQAPVAAAYQGPAPQVWDETGYAAPTVCTDGAFVYAIFATGHVACVSFDGTLQWERFFGPLDNAYGHASSLTRWRDRLLVLIDQGDGAEGKSFLYALDAPTGETLWRAPRPVGGSWATPIVIETDAGPQVITGGDPWLIAYAPDDGAELWRAEVLGMDVAPSPVFAGGFVLAVQPHGQLAAVRPDGRGNVTATHLAWSAYDGVPDISSPVASAELTFLLTSYGMLTCYDTHTGDYLWDHQFAGMFQASPTLVGQRLYLPAEDGATLVFPVASDKPPLDDAGVVQSSRLEGAITASPAFHQGRIYMRTDQYLYCIEPDE